LVTAGVLISIWTAWRVLRTDIAKRPLISFDLDVGSEVSQPAISPDGMTLAFVTSGRLAVRRLGQVKISPLAGTEGASSPFFSPDGGWIGYFAGHKLRKVAVDGGESVTLCDAPMDWGGTWTEDGQIIAALSASGELSRVSASGGTPRPFSDLKSEPPQTIHHRWPFALPGGKGILFITGSGLANGSLRVLPPDGGQAKTLVEAVSNAWYLASGYLVFSRVGTVFAAPMNLNRLELTGPAFPVVERVAHSFFRGADFDVSLSGTVVYRRDPQTANRAVTWLDPSGVKTRIEVKAGAYESPRLSPDGNRLALTLQSAGGQSIWIYDLVRKTMTRPIFTSERQCCPVWSPEGNYVVFSAESALTWIRGDGSGPAERLPPVRGASAVPFSFSPDGKWLTFHRNEPKTGFDLWAVPVDRTGGGLRLGSPQPLLQHPGIQASPMISPDGRWLAYGSDESGRFEVYVVPFSPEGTRREGKWQVSADGGRAPKWTENGGEIFFRSADHHLMAAVIRRKGDSFLAETPRLWSATRLADTGPPNFDITPDGKRAVVLVDADETKADETHLRVLLNIDDELRRQHAAQQRKPK
jgi:serine/threonine-protein kinase